MIVANPEERHGHQLRDANEARIDAQQRRQRLGQAYRQAVKGYPRGTTENVYALPARFSSSSAKIDDPILIATYNEIVPLRARLAKPGEGPDVARQLTALAGRLRPGHRRYLAQQMILVGPPPEASVCGVCWATFSEDARILPCGHTFHEPCLQATLDDAEMCVCAVCKRDLTLAALLHDTAALDLGHDADALWKSLPNDHPMVDPGARPLTPPLSGSAPSLASVKEGWRVKVNEAYNNDTVDKSHKDRKWQVDADLRRLGYSTPKTLRDRANCINDIGRILQIAGFAESSQRAMTYLGKQRTRGPASDPVDLSRRCCVCDTPIGRSEISTAPCRHEVHTECWLSWFQKQHSTQCVICRRDIAVFACMASLAEEEGPDGLAAMKELWLTAGPIYFS